MQVFLFFGILFLSGVWSAPKEHCHNIFLNNRMNRKLQNYTFLYDIYGEMVTNVVEGVIENRCSDAKLILPQVNDDFRNSYNRCNNKNLNQTIEIFIKANVEAFEFLCYNDKLPIYKMKSPRQNYMRRSLTSVFKCLKRYPLLTMIDYSESFCSDANKGLNCINKALRKPKPPILDDDHYIFYGYFKALHSNTPCGATK